MSSKRSSTSSKPMLNRIVVSFTSIDLRMLSENAPKMVLAGKFLGNLKGVFLKIPLFASPQGRFFLRAFSLRLHLQRKSGQKI